ncbi:MAG: hypothetical protein HYV13_01930 [Candidatus Doudnabacteria bacterium]|nr:hypothetical protein [Candidatus Doudnabacteria bacterium]
MDKALIEENRKRLLAEQKRLRSILGFDAVVDGASEFPGEFKPRFPEFGGKDDENANEMAAYETNLAVTSDLEGKLAKVEAALNRIEDGSYGKCKHGDEIESERLIAVPEADTCIKHSV